MPNLPTHRLNIEVVKLVADLFADFRQEVFDGSVTTGDVVSYVQSCRPRTKPTTIYPVIAAFGPVGEKDDHWLHSGQSIRYGRYEV